jgi:long-chain alkane monooxygenase
MAREIRFNAFTSNSSAAYALGLWRHPRDKSRHYNDLSYWTELARVLEAGGFDSVFLADVISVPTLEGRESGVRVGAGAPANDPFAVVGAMAAVTENLGFVVTGNVGFEHPFPFARRMSTLDHLTNGRIGWNIVTSAAFFSQDKGAVGGSGSDDRYRHAEEYAQVCYQLWEGSWADDAVVRDDETGVHTRTERIRDIDHSGEHYTVRSLHQCEPSPQRTPVLFQAGISDQGRDFAAKHAEAILAASLPKELIALYVATIRQAAAQHGRDPRALKCFTSILVIVDATDELAQEKYRDLSRYADPEGGRLFVSTVLAHDLTAYDWDTPVESLRGKVERPIEWFIREKPDGSPWTIRDMSVEASLGLGAPLIVGSPTTVADQLEGWVADTDLDGFNLIAAVSPGSYEDFAEFVVPELRRRGAYKPDYAAGTLRQKLIGADDRLPDEHPAAAHRFPASV